MKKKLYIFGARNFAEVCHHLFTSDSDYDVAGFVVDRKYLELTSFCGLPVIAYEEFLERVPPREADVFIALGIAKMNTLRAAKFHQVQRDGYRIASFVSRFACLPAGFVTRPNTMVMEGALIHPSVEIGSNTIIWAGSRVALKVKIGDHCWITSAAIGDSTTIGDYSFVGLNATVAPFVKVGTHNLIGAAAVVLQDTNNFAVLRGPRSRPSKVNSLRLRNIPLIS